MKVCDVALRHGMASQHLSTWRGLARSGKLPMPVPAEEGPFFAAVEVAPEAVLPSATNEALIEIDADGVVVRLSLSTGAVRIAEIAMALKEG